MNIIFLGLTKIESLTRKDMYIDLLRRLSQDGHHIYSVTCLERRKKENTTCFFQDENAFLMVRTLNMQKTNIVEKGLSMMLINGQYKRAIKKHFRNIKFDLILYPTPPITLYGVIKYLKKRYDAKTYLMLKDIFPQNAVDLGMMKTNGLGGIIHNYFRKKEKRLYAISDHIGCMSQANVDYLLAHNPSINHSKVSIFPNCIEVTSSDLSQEEKNRIRLKYGLPLDRIVFVYGGNLGKPQGIPFLLECLLSQKENKRVFFLVVGDGTEYCTLEKYKNTTKQDNFLLLNRLSQSDFSSLVSACDVGMIFLDYRFSIPNYPSRILSYMQASLPVLVCSDSNTDIGKMVVENGFGWWIPSNSVFSFGQTVSQIIDSDLTKMKIKSNQTLKELFSVEVNYKKII